MVILCRFLWGNHRKLLEIAFVFDYLGRTVSGHFYNRSAWKASAAVQKFHVRVLEIVIPPESVDVALQPTHRIP